MKILSIIEDIRSTISSCEIIIDSDLYSRRIHYESGVGEENRGHVHPAAVSAEENFVEIAGDDIKAAGDSQVITDDIGVSNTLPLNGFFSRPVEIVTINIAPSTDVSNVYDVWDLISREPTVRAKLRNYAYFKAKLKLRVSVSGSPFHTGRLLFSYQPYAIHNTALSKLLENVTHDSSLRSQVIAYLSQAREKWYMDVRDNQPFEITLPFISYKPVFKLFNTAVVNTVVGSATPFEDFEEAGSLYVYTVNQIGAVSATPSNVSVQIYGWFEDVQLGCPTSAQVTITTESGTDEREAGPIEELSSKMAQASGLLTKVPYIGSFASISEMAFGTLSNISSVFGWSRPVLIDNPSYVKNNGFSNGAYTIGAETNFRIVTDPKQEISIDPSMFGHGEDEMFINYLTNIESYFATFSWSPSNPIMGTGIFKIGVNPHMAVKTTTVVAPVNTYVQPTALSYASSPFAFWRGDLIYRFDAVTSAYHRGKLALVYDPAAVQSSLIDATTEFNKPYMIVWDLQQTSSIEVCVKWNSFRSWLRNVPTSNVGDMTGGAFNPSFYHRFINGFISVKPFTELQSPDDSSIEINVFVRSENIKFNGMNGSEMPTSRITYESGTTDMTKPSGFVSEPKGVTCAELAPSSATSDHISHFYFGEQPSSFRALLKRYCRTHSETGSTASTGPGTIIYDSPIVPVVQTQYSTSSDSSSLSPNLFDYLRFAYLGMRGGVKKRLQFIDNGVDNVNGQVKVLLQDPTDTTVIPSVFNSSPNPSIDYMAGLVSFTPHSNAGVEIELPYYSNNLFLFACLPALSPSGNGGQYEQIFFRNFRAVAYYSTVPLNYNVLEESAAGEDFSFYRFLGAPYFTL